MGTTTDTILSSPSLLLYSFFVLFLFPLSRQPLLPLTASITPRAKIATSFNLSLKYSYPPSHFGWRKDYDIAGTNLLCRLDLVMVENLHIVLNVVSQFDAESLGRIEDNLYIV